MDEQTTISLPESIKEELEEGKEKTWGPHLLELKRNSTETVELTDEQIEKIARKAAEYTTESHPDR